LDDSHGFFYQIQQMAYFRPAIGDSPPETVNSAQAPSGKNDTGCEWVLGDCHAAPTSAYLLAFNTTTYTFST